jgi:tetratricopeptide (TPR) repeat protein
MTLVIGKIHGDKLVILSDTQLTYPPDINRSQPEFSQQHPMNGTFKTIIIRKDLAIAFAGDVWEAEKALDQITVDTPLEQVKKILLNVHQNFGRVDFLIASLYPASLYEIKQNNIGEVKQAWLGNRDGFALFQKYLLEGVPSRNQTSIEMNFSSQSQPPEFSKMSKAFDGVISYSGIADVGGFQVKVLAGNTGLEYAGYLHTYQNPSEVKINLSKPDLFIHSVGHGTAAEGSYTINFYYSSPDYRVLAIHFLQGNFGITYHRKETGLFSIAVESNKDEFEFADFVQSVYKVRPHGTSCDPSSKYLPEGKRHFQNGKLEEALSVYEKGIKYTTGRHRAQFYFESGKCLIRLSRNPAAMRYFEQAVKIDPSIKQNTMSFLVNHFKVVNTNQR